MKSILDPSFKYTNSASTNVAKTFARARRQQREAAEQARKVVPITQARVNRGESK